MPLNYNSNNASSPTSPGIPIISNNPVFQVKTVAMDGRMEQKPNQKDDSAEQDAIKVGDSVNAEVVSGTDKSGKKVTGKVLSINKDDNQISSYTIITKGGKELDVDPTTTTKIKVHGGSVSDLTVSNTVAENRVFSFTEWLDRN